MDSLSRFFPLSGFNSSSSSLSSLSSSSSDNVIDTMIQRNQDAFREILNSVNPEIIEQVFKPPYDDYFIQKRDAIGHLGLSSIQKMTTVICILAYGCAADHCDEYIKIGESTAIETLMTFCKAVIGVYGEEYMHPPNEAKIARQLQEGEERGFPGMLVFIDCMHWEWKNCLVAWHGMHKGCSHTPTLILEAVASKDLWIWHAFFGMSGSYNDINVLDHSSVFDSIVTGQIPPVNFVVNGHYHTMGYYLSDGIYPKWATLMQIISQPTTVKEKLFAQR
ncbi:uncharacterized protein LOC132296100 [Cornus florida]|uniref:uncharacterized protein LOC132296100 n=1 Tax=Cornus florida TaxID=4283 RepID=UPI00289D6FA7|nr:uncharacterized protein LOC132296100 [Cornus florida]